MVQLCVEFCNAVEQGNKDRDRALNDFNDNFTNNFTENIVELSGDMKKSSQKHEKEMEKIDEKIMTVTEEYRELFQQIMNNQKEMQAMSKEDMALLRTLAKG